MPIKKSDLYSSLWASCDELRGGMDASQYKDCDIYQHLMDYCATTQQDDAYLIAVDSWVAHTIRIVETDKKGKDKGWTCELTPESLVVARYFSAEQAALDAKQAELEAACANWQSATPTRCRSWSMR